MLIIYSKLNYELIICQCYPCYFCLFLPIFASNCTMPLDLSPSLTNQYCYPALMTVVLPMLPSITNLVCQATWNEICPRLQNTCAAVFQCIKTPLPFYNTSTRVYLPKTNHKKDPYLPRGNRTGKIRGRKV